MAIGAGGTLRIPRNRNLGYALMVKDRIGHLSEFCLYKQMRGEYRSAMSMVHI